MKYPGKLWIRESDGEDWTDHGPILILDEDNDRIGKCTDLMCVALVGAGFQVEVECLTYGSVISYGPDDLKPAVAS